MLSSQKKTKEPIPWKLLIRRTDRPYSYDLSGHGLESYKRISQLSGKTNTNLFKSTTNNIAPFVSITWHQKEPLGCVVYSHCPTNDSYNKCIHCCCLPCNYVTKPFGILQRVIKSQRVYIYHLDSAKVEPFLSEKLKQLNFQKI